MLADLVELTGDLDRRLHRHRHADSAPPSSLTDKTVYVANQVLEMIGGMLQAHLNVEPVRHWANPTHWGDTPALLPAPPAARGRPRATLWQTRLRSFGAHDGVLSFRHDVHGMRDYTFLDYQIENLIPASYDIEDPGFSTNISEDDGGGLGRPHDAAHASSSPRSTTTARSATRRPRSSARASHDHVRSATQRLGIPVCTCGRHAGGHMHPETLDAMDYLYAHDDRVLGMCTFCYYHMIEYGVRNPDVMVGGLIGGKPLTYVTDVRRTIATPGIWFPFHPVITTDEEWRPLRGWDRTHEYDAACELVETIFGGHSARVPGVDDRLENGVYSFQYHPELARDPSVNDGKGTLDYLRYAINLAERQNLWIATQRDLYQRMADYEALIFQVRDERPRRDGVEPDRPAHRRHGDRAAPAVRQRLARRPRSWSTWCAGAFVTVPPLATRRRGDARASRDEAADAPLVRQPSNKGLIVLDARRDPRTGETVLRGQGLPDAAARRRRRRSRGRLPRPGRRRGGATRCCRG